MFKTIIICATVAFVAVLSAFVFLSYKGLDTTSLITFSLGLMAALVPGIGSYVKSHEAASTAAENKADIEEVKHVITEKNGGAS